jgi:hypothetical protein
VSRFRQGVSEVPSFAREASGRSLTIPSYVQVEAGRQGQVLSRIEASELQPPYRNTPIPDEGKLD